MQAMENDRIEAKIERGQPSDGSKINYYSVAPGYLKTDFSHNAADGKDPKLGAEVIVQIIADEELKFEGGTQWEFEDGEMKIVPW